MSKAKFIRRTTGGLCLAGALLLLAGGDTQPAGGADHLRFALYWLACFALAIAAMILAVLDLFAVRSEARQAQRQLFEETLAEIPNRKPAAPSGPPPASKMSDAPAGPSHRAAGDRSDR